MKDDWAAEKVRVYYPHCKEKTTLWALAHYANREGTNVWPSHDTVAHDTGQSARTVRRHVKTLVMRGDLVTWCDVKRSRDSNFYFVPICTETVTELEERTGISRRQLKLPIVTELPKVAQPITDIDRAQVLQSLGVSKRPTPKVRLSQGVGQTDPVTHPLTRKEHSEGNFNYFRDGEGEGRPLGEVSPVTQKLINDTLERLAKTAAEPMRFQHREFFTTFQILDEEGSDDPPPNERATEGQETACLSEHQADGVPAV